MRISDWSSDFCSSDLWLVDALASGQGERFAFDGKLHGEACRVRLGGEPVWLLKPATFMNKSGIAVVSALRYYKIEPEQCLVAHDDLDQIGRASCRERVCQYV